MEYVITPRVPGVRPQDPPDYDGITFAYVFTQVLDPWVQPPVLGQVSLYVANAQGFVPGMTVVIENGGYYEVVSTNALDRMIVQNFGTNYNVAPGTGIAPGKVTTTSLPGPPGGNGSDGPVGPAGPVGPPGGVGPSGPTGSQGSQGVQGLTGVQGPQGNQGPIGQTGATGSQGSPGATGPTGAQGTQGSPGIAGPQGVPGQTGPTGPKGADGSSIVLKGTVPTSANLPATGNSFGDLYVTANTGHGWVWSSPGSWVDVGPIQGPTGPTGATGPIGPQGAQGNTGIQGVAGATGAQGSTGPTGPTGPAGSAATVAVGTTTTGAAGSNAAVNNSGSSSAAIFNFTVPQGSQGIQGVQGPVGPQGSKGDTGLTGPTGAPGPTVISLDPGNQATLGSDSKIYVPALVPTGTVLDFAGPSTSVPAGFLPCDGSAVSQATYGALFALIGSTYGAAPAGMFALPDTRGRVAVGAGQGTSLTNRALGAISGEESHLLLTTEMPSHTHTLSAHTHTMGNHTHAGVGHTHSITAGQFNHTHTISGGANVAMAAPAVALQSGSGQTFYTPVNMAIAGATLPAGVTASSSEATGGPSTNTTAGPSTNTTNSIGGDVAHNTMQPYIVFNKIIKT